MIQLEDKLVRGRCFGSQQRRFGSGFGDQRFQLARQVPAHGLGHFAATADRDALPQRQGQNLRQDKGLGGQPPHFASELHQQVAGPRITVAAGFQCAFGQPAELAGHILLLQAAQHGQRFAHQLDGLRVPGLVPQQQAALEVVQLVGRQQGAVFHRHVQFDQKTRCRRGKKAGKLVGSHGRSRKKQGGIHDKGLVSGRVS